MTLIEKGSIETCSLLVRRFYWELEMSLDAYIEADSLASTYVYVGLRRFPINQPIVGCCLGYICSMVYR